MALSKRPVEVLRKTEFLKVSEVAELTGVSRFILNKYILFDLLPFHRVPGKRAKYYRLAEVRKVLAALEPLRAKEIPLKHLRAELDRLKWYCDLRQNDKTG